MTRQTVKTLSAFFGWSFLLCVGLQLFAFGMITQLHDVAYGWHSHFFNLSVEAFNIASYSMIGLMKTLGLTFFLTPWAALKIVEARLED